MLNEIWQKKTEVSSISQQFNSVACHTCEWHEVICAECSLCAPRALSPWFPSPTFWHTRQCFQFSCLSCGRGFRICFCTFPCSVALLVGGGWDRGYGRWEPLVFFPIALQSPVFQCQCSCATEASSKYGNTFPLILWLHHVCTSAVKLDRIWPLVLYASGQSLV